MRLRRYKWFRTIMNWPKRIHICINDAYTHLKLAMCPRFKEFPHIKRFSRECIITEKIDGTNAQIYITGSGKVYAGSRNRWLTVKNDNYGFAVWVEHNKKVLKLLGIGRHYGEWYGKGINRGYGLQDRRLALFNVRYWEGIDVVTKQRLLDVGVNRVPYLDSGIFSSELVEKTQCQLKEFGSHVTVGYMKPEGIIIYHCASNTYFKKTLENDDVGKERR